MIYKTVQGDLWDIISYKVFDSGSYTSEIMKLNPEHHDTIVFTAGIELILPDIEVNNELLETKAPWE